MPQLKPLLPRSAAPYKPRSPPFVIKNKGDKRRLGDILSSPSSIWLLCSMNLSTEYGIEPYKYGDNSRATSSDDDRIDIKAYVVYVDVKFRNEIIFKLTPETIGELIGYDTKVHCQRNCLARQGLQRDFRHAVNEFVFTVKGDILAKLDANGGELDSAGWDTAGEAIMNLLGMPLHMETKDSQKPSVQCILGTGCNLTGKQTLDGYCGAAFSGFDSTYCSNAFGVTTPESSFQSPFSYRLYVPQYCNIKADYGAVVVPEPVLQFPSMLVWP